MFLCRYCEESLAESVATLIWVAPRLCSDIQELNQVSSRHSRCAGTYLSHSVSCHGDGAEIDEEVIDVHTLLNYVLHVHSCLCIHP